jgi:hypothetical protein
MFVLVFYNISSRQISSMSSGPVRPSLAKISWQVCNRCRFNGFFVISRCLHYCHIKLRNCGVLDLLSAAFQICSRISSGLTDQGIRILEAFIFTPQKNKRGPLSHKLAVLNVALALALVGSRSFILAIRRVSFCSWMTLVNSQIEIFCNHVASLIRQTLGFLSN